MQIASFILMFLLSLAGCGEQGGRLTVSTARNDGMQVDTTRATIANGIGRFDCVHSGTGQCHWLLVANGREVAHFTVLAGARRHMDRLPPGTKPCVSTEALPLLATCLK